MEKYFYYGLLLLYVQFLSCTSKTKDNLNIPVGSDSIVVHAMDSVARHFMAQNNLPGAVIGLIENGMHIETLYYGYSNVEKKQKIDGNTLFNLGSISKSLTAWGILKLVEEGKIALDSSANKYLKAWRFPPHDFDASKITIRRLLGHSAGLSLSGYPGFKPNAKLPSVMESLNGATNGPGRVEVIYDPGTEARYSGGGFTVLQLIIENVSQMSFSDFMAKNIFVPLDMQHSTFEIIDSLHPLQSKLAKPYDGDGLEIADLKFTALAAAGLRSTANDMIKFLLSELHLFDREVLSEKSISSMHAINPPAKRYGLGHQIRSFNTKTIIGHVGNNQGWHSNFEFIPETKSGIVILTNGNDGFYFHNKIMCNWINYHTGIYPLEFCATEPLAKIGDLHDKVSLWKEQKYITATQKDSLNAQFHIIRSIGPSDIERVIKGLKTIDSNLSEKYPSIPKSNIKAYHKISEDVLKGLTLLITPSRDK